jgi:hypothetical protein
VRTYASELRGQLDLNRHRAAATLAPPAAPRREGPNTTHLSVADRKGGLVALTTTLNFAYGNGVSVPGAGFLLNNEMDDFTASPGQPNAYGLVQGEANAIAPGQAAAQFDEPHPGVPGRWLPLAGHRQPRRQPHHHHRAAGAAGPAGAWPQPGRRRGQPAGAQPALARPDQPRAGHQPRHPGAAAPPRPPAAAGAGHGFGQQRGGAAWPDGGGGGSLGVADPRRLDAAAVAE